MRHSPASSELPEGPSTRQRTPTKKKLPRRADRAAQARWYQQGPTRDSGVATAPPKNTRHPLHVAMFYVPKAHWCAFGTDDTGSRSLSRACDEHAYMHAYRIHVCACRIHTKVRDVVSLSEKLGRVSCCASRDAGKALLGQDRTGQGRVSADGKVQTDSTV